MKKPINFLKFGLKLTCCKLKAKPCITSTKAIGIVLFLAIYGLAVSFAVNIIEAQGACSSQLTCSGTELDDFQVGKLGVGVAAPSTEGELKVNGNAYITGGELKAKWLHSTAAGDNTFVGNVGIGDTSPNQKLGLLGTNAQISIEEGNTEFLRMGVGETAGTSVIGWDDADKLYLGVYSSPTDTTISSKVTIQSNGNVGIGTTDPGAKLDVAGNIKIRGGSPSAGKVLTSDASGLASWQSKTGRANSHYQCKIFCYVYYGSAWGAYTSTAIAGQVPCMKLPEPFNTGTTYSVKMISSTTCRLCNCK